MDSIPIDFDKLWNIDVFVLFTIGLGLSGTKKKPLPGHKTPWRLHPGTF
jgi:hypothetical protein